MKLFKSKGFTLIELLVVIAILGILAAVLMVALNPAQRMAAARNSTVKSDITSAGSQANLFNTDTGSGAGCVASYAPAWNTNTISCNPVIANYMIVAPLDPNGTAYTYKSASAVGGIGAQGVASAVLSNCNPVLAATPCVAVAISGPAFRDGSVYGGVAVTNNGTWCWRSATGSVTYVVAPAPYAAGVGSGCNP